MSDTPEPVKRFLVTKRGYYYIGRGRGFCVSPRHAWWYASEAEARRVKDAIAADGVEPLPEHYYSGVSR